MNSDPREQNDMIVQMARAILSDILDQVIGEFETAIGTEIGAIHISPPNRATGKRQAEIEIRRTGGEKLDGLMKYKKILCEYESLKDDEVCTDD